MRHRFHSICPYFAMFPEVFVKKHLAASQHEGVVFDPFCGRGTTMFQALLQGRMAAGCDTNPVAVCVSQAKCDAPEEAEAMARVEELRTGCHEPDDGNWCGALKGFFDLCFHTATLLQIRYLRSVLEWRDRKADRFLAALCLGALHGESHRSPNCFSNRMPRTISTKPDYSVRWWTKRGDKPPHRDVFEILERMVGYRFRSRPPDGVADVVQGDARQAGEAFPQLAGRVTDVITSPPYIDTTNYREDQWLRLWFLGGDSLVQHDRRDDRHYDAALYWAFLRAAWGGLAPLLSDSARMVIRIGGRKFGKKELRCGLMNSLNGALDRDVRLLDDGVTSEVSNTQSNSFRGSKTSGIVEHDFCFAV